MPSLELHTFFRSSAAYRVRIALNLKGLAYTPRYVDLMRGDQQNPEYRQLNPEARIPSLVVDGRVLTQSLAILEYLEETHPQPPLLPGDPIDRAWVRALALIVACDIHPLNNLRVLDYLGGNFGQDEAARLAWMRHWIGDGLAAVEAHLAGRDGGAGFCLGDTPTLADICLVPQVFNARRAGCDLSAFPRILAVEARCLALPAFQEAAPDRQPDAP